MILVVILAPVSLRGTDCISSKLSCAQIEGSKTPWGADWGVNKFAGKRLKANLPREF